MRRKRRILLTVFAVIVVIAAVLAALATYYTDYLWFAHLGFGTVFTTRLLAELAVGGVYGLAAALVLGGHVLLLRRLSSPRSQWRLATMDGQIVEIGSLVRRLSTPIVVAAVLVIAVLLGVWASGQWEEILRFLHRTPFGQQEPILGQDLGFYLFVLPALQFAQQWLLTLALLAAGLVLLVYIARGEITLRDRHLEIAPPVRAHLLGALAFVLLVLAFGWRLEMFETLFSRHGVAYGATYTDVHARLVFFRVMIVLTIGVALFLVALMRVRLSAARSVTFPAYALAGLVVVYLLGGLLWPALVQNLSVSPNELDKERPYLVNAIAGTRRGFDLDRIKVEQFPASEHLTLTDLQANKTTIDNIRIWDNRPLRATYKQMQAIRLYYDFPSITVDRYSVDEQYWQVLLSARELVIGQLPEQSQTWVNRHLQYTHGYGVCLSPVKRVVGEGLPDLWIKDIPPESRHPHLAITRPEIYYGQQTTDYVLVKTNTKEFDYPRGSENVYATYGGRGGVGIGTLLRRVLFAARFGDSKLLFTGYLTPESRLLFNRRVQDRVAEVAPFLTLDSEPYMVVAGGRLYWILDAYTSSVRFPYSQPWLLGGHTPVNYVRNSVKAVVDAYDGTVTLYLWDEHDPVVATYAKIFPGLFTPREKMPAILRRHVRYPKDLFAVQAAMYESFHMTDPQVFYNQEDKWAVSRELGEKTRGRLQEEGELGRTPTGPRAGPRFGQAPAVPGLVASRMDPTYMIMRLPGEPREEFLLMVPYTPSNKDNMVAWLTARCDGDHLGKLLVFTFPKKKLVFGPMQIEARIDQDAYISEWITLRNQQGSVVIRGDLMVLPIKDAILYVEPIYLQSTQTKLPELKQVVVAFGKRLTMKETLPAALQEVFRISADEADALAGLSDKAVPRPPSAASAPTTLPAAAAAAGAAVSPAGLDDARALLQQAVSRYRLGRERIAAGDWAGYGAAQKELEATLERLAAKLQVELRPPARTPGPPARTPGPPVRRPAPPKAPPPVRPAPGGTGERR